MMPEIGSPHKVTHQNGGNDEISLTGLSGLVGDSQTPLAHKTSHQDGGADEISVAGLSGQVVFVPYHGKISDITQADTNKYFLDLATALSESRDIVALIIKSIRVSGTGTFNVYPNEGTTQTYALASNGIGTVMIASLTKRLQYSLSVANDDWDIICFGYVVTGA